ncbi:clathrin light chain B-like isoform X2 [Centruroides sculpturatus]|uniref:clathrin light chain B-like isoform X2 n=1 Tax=Centruroides sculpturatus TaxID=218467 RepID=UPI000C6DC0EC|nr:clathrin light chain B-like isoform X2 [Centruroides sculpturatus]
MEEYEAFEANFNNVGEEEEDPAAEFLAREQTELAGLEDDNFDVSENRGLAATESANDIFPESQMNGNLEAPLPASMTVLQNKSSVFREEPEKIRKWRESQQEMLQKKDSEEELKKAELRETANKEIEEWYARYKEQVEKAKLNNRNAEKEWIEERDAGTPGQDWERIARLCDFNPKSSRSTRDTSRMRSIILQLKQSPPIQRA